MKLSGCNLIRFIDKSRLLFLRQQWNLLGQNKQIAEKKKHKGISFCSFCVEKNATHQPTFPQTNILKVISIQKENYTE